MNDKRIQSTEYGVERWPKESAVGARNRYEVRAVAGGFRSLWLDRGVLFFLPIIIILGKS